MKSLTQPNALKIFSTLVVFLTALQGLVPAMPITNPYTITLVSSILMFLVSALTAWKQYFAVDIKMSALRPTIFVAILATVGGLNQLFDVVHLSPLVSQWVRFGLTFVTMAINLTSKLLYPDA